MNGDMLSQYPYILCIFEEMGKFDFVEVDHKDREIKGKSKDVNIFQAFF